jgi:hypothetical protein
MDRVVGYDYPIDNKEEMKMEVIRLKDITGDEAEVSLLTNRTGTVKTVITLDVDPYDDGITIMHYTPGDARKLAAALIIAAEEAEKR